MFFKFAFIDGDDAEFFPQRFDPVFDVHNLLANVVETGRGAPVSEESIPVVFLDVLGNEDVDDVFHLINNIVNLLHHRLCKLILFPLLGCIPKEGFEDEEIPLQFLDVAPRVFD